MGNYVMIMLKNNQAKKLRMAKSSLSLQRIRKVITQLNNIEAIPIKTIMVVLPKLLNKSAMAILIIFALAKIRVVCIWLNPKSNIR